MTKKGCNFYIPSFFFVKISISIIEEPYKKGKENTNEKNRRKDHAVH